MCGQDSAGNTDGPVIPAHFDGILGATLLERFWNGLRMGARREPKLQTFDVNVELRERPQE
jgi:hypothetical protein